MMRNMLCVAFLALLAACSRPVAPSVPNPVPVALRSCPGGAAKPPAPGVPRTIESLADGYNRQSTARETNEVARDVCASKLKRLNQYVRSLKRK